MPSQKNNVYHQNDFGYSSRCGCHCHLQLVFGNIALLMSVEEFIGLKKQVHHTYQHFSGSKCIHCKDIYVDTSVNNMSFVFSYWEVEQLYEIMKGTTLLLEVEGILQDK